MELLGHTERKGVDIVQQRIKQIGLAAALLAILFPIRAYAAQAQPLTVTFHYDRLEQDYDGFHIWSWIDAEEGHEYDFSGVDDYGTWTQVSYSNVPEGSQIGFLIKLNDWEPGEVRTDRFLDLSRVQNGMLDVYILQGEDQVYYSAEELPKDGRFIYTYLDTFSEVNFMMMNSRGAGKPEFTVTDDTGKQYPMEVSRIRTEGRLTIGILSVEGITDLRKTLYLNCNELSQVICARRVFDTPRFQERFCYEGDDLGAVWTPECTAFRLWAPTASKAEVLLYRHGTIGGPVQTHTMERAEGGTWYAELAGNFDQVYYTYRVTVEGETHEVVDPYAKACGLNGQRGMVVDLNRTDPENFCDEAVKNAGISKTPIIWEANVRDLSMDGDAGFSNRGTYRAAAQAGIVNSAGDAVGIDYLEKLGITYVQIMPVQDSPDVDESDVAASYNWGYMTQHYFIPEGAYSVNPSNGNVRIREFKELVGALHQRGIGVIMDVVYNHTVNSSELENIVPGYYYRLNQDGSLSNGSACGNEMATERAMVQKLIIDSACYWLNEYHVDGFRLDLMGLIDMGTLRDLRDRLSAVRPDVLLYGEGWTGGESSYEGKTGMSENAGKLLGIGMFDNVYRQAIQKYVCGIFEEEQVDGKVRNIVPDVCFGIVAALEHPATQSVGYWTQNSRQCVNYASCHDGYTLWDQIRLSTLNDSEDLQRQRSMLAASVTMLAQGIPFFQSGEEFLRSKTVNNDLNTVQSNTFNAGDEFNSLKWAQSSENRDVVEYYKGLITFRKAHPGMLLNTAEEVQERLEFLNVDTPMIAYTVREKGPWWRDTQVCVIHNPLEQAVSVSLPGRSWKVYVQDGQAGTDILGTADGKSVDVAAVSTMVLIHTSLSVLGWCVLGSGTAVVIGVALWTRKKKKPQ